MKFAGKNEAEVIEEVVETVATDVAPLEEA
jgi:hypothetical protein